MFKSENVFPLGFTLHMRASPSYSLPSANNIWHLPIYYFLPIPIHMYINKKVTPKGMFMHSLPSRYEWKVDEYACNCVFWGVGLTLLIPIYFAVYKKLIALFYIKAFKMSSDLTFISFSVPLSISWYHSMYATIQDMSTWHLKLALCPGLTVTLFIIFCIFGFPHVRTKVVSSKDFWQQEGKK